MFSDIRTIFFDLDNTLFDHSQAERAALREILRAEPEWFASIDAGAFVVLYDEINTKLWSMMAAGELSADELRVRRLQETFAAFGLRDLDFLELSRKYLQVYTQQLFVFPGMMKTLLYLKPRYTLGLLSNGFVEIQKQKLARMRISELFDVVVYSEEVGAMKPAAEIFFEAMRRSDSQPDEIVYVGDSFDSDIVGAKAVGWRAVLFNPHGKTPAGRLADAEISRLSELTKLF